MNSEANGHWNLASTCRVIDLGVAPPHPPAATYQNKNHRRRKEQVTLLTKSQTAYLEDIFKGRNLPLREKKDQAAYELGLPYRRIENWFRNRRQRQRKASGLLVKRGPRVQLSEPPPFPPMSSSGSSPGPSFAFAPRSASMGPSISLSRTATGTSPAPDDEFTFAPLLSLTVGSWMHLSSPTASLHGHLFPCAERLSWLIRDAETGHDNMITMPFDSILSAEVRASGPILPTVLTTDPPLNYAVGVVELSRPPQFFSRTDVAQRGDEAKWLPSEDWTEGRQGTLVLQHYFQGPAPSVDHFVSALNAHIMRNDWDAFSGTPQEMGLSVAPSHQSLYEPEGSDFQHQGLRGMPTFQPARMAYLVPGGGSHPSASTSYIHHTSPSTTLPPLLSADHLATAPSCMVYGPEGNGPHLEARGAHEELQLHHPSPFVGGLLEDENRSASAIALHHIPLQAQHSYPSPSTGPSTQSRPRTFQASEDPSFHGYTTSSFFPSTAQQVLRSDPHIHPPHPLSAHWGMYDEPPPFFIGSSDVTGEYPLAVPSSDVDTGSGLPAPKESPPDNHTLGARSPVRALPKPSLDQLYVAL